MSGCGVLQTDKTCLTTNFRVMLALVVAELQNWRARVTDGLLMEGEAWPPFQDSWQCTEVGLNLADIRFINSGSDFGEGLVDFQ